MGEWLVRAVHSPAAASSSGPACVSSGHRASPPTARARALGVASGSSGAGGARVWACGLQEAVRVNHLMRASDGIEAVRTERRERARSERIISDNGLGLLIL